MMLVFALLCAIAVGALSLTKHIDVWISIYVMWSVALVFFPLPKKTNLSTILLLSLLLRLIFIGTEPILSDDLYRYLWEGKLWMQGGNPYIQPPNSFDVIDPYLSKINHPHIPSVYPPIAMWCFALFSKISYTVVFFKAMFALFDLGIIWLLYQLLPQKKRMYTWIYALHPLPILESASSGHLDVMGVFFLLLAIWMIGLERKNWGGFALVLGGGIKILPFVFLPWCGYLGCLGFFMGLLVLGFAGIPMWEISAFQGLQIYLEHWSFNGSLYPIVHHFLPSISRRVLVSIWIAIIGFLWVQHKRKERFEISTIALYILGTWVLFSPTVHPWYGMWVFPFAILCGSRSWTLLCSLLPLSYHALLTVDPVTQNWNPSIWPQIIEYSLPCLLFLFPTISKRCYNPFPSFNPIKTSKMYSSQSQT
jgi:alpha-1,6-mannosyltransferase